MCINIIKKLINWNIGYWYNKNMFIIPNELINQCNKYGIKLT